jgi:hypothetical protein
MKHTGIILVANIGTIKRNIPQYSLLSGYSKSLAHTPERSLWSSIMATMAYETYQ